MYAVIYKNDEDNYVILDAYFKGRWAADKKSLLVYLHYLDLWEKSKKMELREALIKCCGEYGLDDEYTAQLYDFFMTEDLPAVCNFDPLYLAGRLDSFGIGIITPPTPILEVTPYCNYRCPWCYIPPRHIDKEQFYTLGELEDNVIKPLLQKYGLLEWCLTGGEPSVEPERTIQTARLITGATLEVLGKRPASIYLLTNGYNLAKNLERYKEAGINRYQVALSSPDPQTERKLRRPPGNIDSHDHAVQGLKEVVKKRLRAEINMIIQPQGAHEADNLQDIPAMFDLAAAIGVDMLRIIPAVPCGQAISNNVWMSSEEYDMVRTLVRQGRTKAGEMVIDCPIDQEIEKDREIFCRAGTLWIYINFRGEIYPCNNLQNKDSLCWDETIKTTPLDEIWEKSRLLRFMRDYDLPSLHEDCIGCGMRVECVGECRALAWARYKRYDLAEKPQECFRDLNIKMARGY